MTPEEKTTIKAELAKFPGAGNDVIERELNKDGSALVETWATVPVTEERIKLHKAILLVALTAAERKSLRALLEAGANKLSDEAADFKMLYESTDTFDVNDPAFIAMLNSLQTTLGVKADTVSAIKRQGQRKISRAEELIGRKITLEEAQEALNE